MTDAEYDALPPQEIIEAAARVSRYFSENGMHEWALEGCASRREVETLRAQVATMSASNDDLAAECARLRAKHAVACPECGHEFEACLIDAAASELLQRSEAECARLREECGAAAAWILEWIVAEKYHKPDAPAMVKDAQRRYREEIDARKKAEAALAAAQAVISELVECKDLNNAATRLLHEDAGSIQHGRIMKEKAKEMDAEYSRRIGPAWKAARAIIDAARERTC